MRIAETRRPTDVARLHSRRGGKNKSRRNGANYNYQGWARPDDRTQTGFNKPAPSPYLACIWKQAAFAACCRLWTPISHHDLQQILRTRLRQPTHAGVIDDQQRHTGDRFHILFASALQGRFGDLLQKDMRLAIEHLVALQGCGLSDGLRQMAFARVFAAIRWHFDRRGCSRRVRGGHNADAMTANVELLALLFVWRWARGSEHDRYTIVISPLWLRTNS